MCAWEPVPQYEKGSATFSPIWTTAGKKSSDDVAPSFRLAPQN